MRHWAPKFGTLARVNNVQLEACLLSLLSLKLSSSALSHHRTRGMSSSKLSLSLPAAAAARRSTLRLSRRIFPRHASTAAAAATKLNSVTEADLTHFASILEPSSILSTIHSTSTSSNARQANDPSELDQYNLDWMGKYRGHSTTVLRPKTTEQVSKILEYCNERRIGVVPQGGNTGLVGGSVPVGNEVVINLGGMANIRSFDPVSGMSFTIHRGNKL